MRIEIEVAEFVCLGLLLLALLVPSRFEVAFTDPLFHQNYLQYIITAVTKEEQSSREKNDVVVVIVDDNKAGNLRFNYKEKGSFLYPHYFKNKQFLG